MKRQLNTLGAALLAGLALTTTALAQAPGNGAPGNGGGGGRGGFNNRMAAGAVTAVDAAAGTVTITSRATNQPEVVKVAAGTPIATQATVPISDLKIGDSVNITGMPTAISFSQITVGDLPAGFPGARNGNQNGGPGGGNAAAPNAAPPVQAYAMATGKVKSLNPLTIDLGGGLTLTPTAAANAKISRISTQTVAGLAVGDQFMAMGQTDADGSFTATAVAVNWPLGAGGAGGRGFGGRGGGFGGGFGGRGRRGGQGGNQGGNAGNQGGGNNAPAGNGQ